MTGDPALSITEPTDTQIPITRRFAAPPPRRIWCTGRGPSRS